MKKLLLLAFLVAAFTSCITTYRDIDLQTSPEVFRGIWTGTLKNRCVDIIGNASWNSTGTRVAGLVNGNIVVWDITTGAALSTFNLQANYLQNLALNSAGTELLVQTGDSLARYAVGGSLIYRLNFIPQLYSLSADLERTVTLSYTANTIALDVWNTRDRNSFALLLLPKNSIVSKAVLNTDGSKVAVISYTVNTDTKTLRVFDVITRNVVFETAEPANVRWDVQDLVFRANDVLAQISEYSRTDARFLKAGVSRWSLTNSTLQGYVPTFQSNVRFLPDGQQAWVSMPDGLKVWDMDTGVQTLNLSTPSVWRSLAPNLSRGLVAINELCGEQIYDFATQSLAQKIVIDQNENLTSTFNFTATYQTSLSYKITGTAQIGAESYLLDGMVYNYCRPTSTFSQECINYLRPAFSPLPPPGVTLSQNGVRIGGMTLFMQKDATGRYIQSPINLNGKNYNSMLRPVL